MTYEGYTLALLPAFEGFSLIAEIALSCSSLPALHLLEPRVAGPELDAPAPSLECRPSDLLLISILYARAMRPANSIGTLGSPPVEGRRYYD